VSLEQTEDRRTIAGLAVSGGLDCDQVTDGVKSNRWEIASPVRVRAAVGPMGYPMAIL
jgi:hypothetical protein